MMLIDEIYKNLILCKCDLICIFSPKLNMLIDEIYINWILCKWIGKGHQIAVNLHN